MIPDPRKSGCFRFTRCSYDPANGLACLVYQFDDGPELVEQISFPSAPWPADASRQAAFQRALEILHLVAGVSYYKAGLSPRIQLDMPGVAAGLDEFLTGLYVHGLAEFAYVNRLDVASRVNFREQARDVNDAAALTRTLDLPERALVAIGGGKDSLVGLEMMRNAGIEVLPACIGHSALISDTVRAAGLPLLQIGRKLAPELPAMNRAGAWNGHVPVTAINSAILLCAGILYGYPYIVFSNERSADEATLIAEDGTVVNHQYSKSSAFEAAFREVIATNVSPDIEYFSILRPFSELGIVQRFSTMKKFHGVFSSCNRNFHLDGPRLEGRWCLDCPKCRFAALGLALFLTPPELVSIQGGDLLDDPGQIEGFRALCGLGRDKPFECVGEAGESRAALLALGSDSVWAEHAIVCSLRKELKQVDAPLLDELLQPSSRHFIPPAVMTRLQTTGQPDAGE